MRFASFWCSPVLVALFVENSALAIDEFCVRQVIAGVRKGVPRPDLESWENLQRNSTPVNHDPEHYAYLVHALPSYEEMNRMVKSAGGGDKGGVNLWDSPERINEKLLLSTSLISNEQFGIYTKQGLILEVPEQNIIAAASPETKTRNWHTGPEAEQEKARLRKVYGLPSPFELVHQSKPRIWNEVAIEGMSDTGSKVKVIGVFIGVDLRGVHTGNPSDIARLQGMARRLNVPVIHVPDVTHTPMSR